METYKTIEQDIENITNKEVVKQFRISGIAVGLILGAVLCAWGGMKYEDPNSSMPTLLFTASAFLFLIGIVKLFVSRNFYLFRPTKSRLKPVTLYFDVHESDVLQSCIEMKRFEEIGKLKREKDTGVKLDAMIAGDGKFAAVQISEYIPYSYQAVTPVKCYYGEDAQTFVSSFKASE